MKRLAILALAAIVPLVAVTGCKSVPKVACSIVDAATITCASGGVSLNVAIPPDIGAVVGLIAPSLGIGSLSVSRAGVVSTGPPVTIDVDQKAGTVTLRNPVTGKSATFVPGTPLSP